MEVKNAFLERRVSVERGFLREADGRGQIRAFRVRRAHGHCGGDPLPAVQITNGKEMSAVRTQQSPVSPLLPGLLQTEGQRAGEGGQEGRYTRKRL